MPLISCNPCHVRLQYPLTLHAHLLLLLLLLQGQSGELESDLRRMMLPFTAASLRESKRNTLKDFLAVAGPLGVSHFLILTATEKSTYLRVAKTPRVRNACMRHRRVIDPWRLPRRSQQQQQELQQQQWRAIHGGHHQQSAEQCALFVLRQHAAGQKTPWMCLRGWVCLEIVTVSAWGQQRSSGYL